MVAAFGFFEFVQVFVELRFFDEACAVNPLQLRIAFVPFPVSAGDVEQLERLDPSGGRNVRPAAEINKFSGGVERDQRLDGLFFHKLALESLIGIFVELQRLGLRQKFPLVRQIACGDLVHLRFNFFKIFRSEWFGTQEFVEEPVVNRRPDAQLDVRIEFEDRCGKKMRGRMPENLNRVRVLRGENRQRGILVERQAEIDQVAVGARDERLFRQPRRYLLRHFGRSRSFRNFALCAVWQRDLDGVHILRLRTLDLLAYWPGARTVKVR